MDIVLEDLYTFPTADITTALAHYNLSSIEELAKYIHNLRSIPLSLHQGNMINPEICKNTVDGKIDFFSGVKQEELVDDEIIQVVDDINPNIIHCFTAEELVGIVYDNNGQKLNPYNRNPLPANIVIEALAKVNVTQPPSTRIHKLLDRPDSDRKALIRRLAEKILPDRNVYGRRPELDYVRYTLNNITNMNGFKYVLKYIYDHADADTFDYNIGVILGDIREEPTYTPPSSPEPAERRQIRPRALFQNEPNRDIMNTEWFRNLLPNVQEHFRNTIFNRRNQPEEPEYDER